MTSVGERNGARLGVAVAVLTLGLIAGVGLILDSPKERTSAPPIADLDDTPLPGGAQMTLLEASKVFPVPVYRPNVSLASDDTVSEVWVRVNNAPETWIQYRSGIVVLVRPIGDLQQTRDYANAQIADGVPGRIVTFEGVDGFLVPQTENGSGSVRLVLDGTVVTVIGYLGDFSVDQLTDSANSIVKTSNEIAAAAPA